MHYLEVLRVVFKFLGSFLDVLLHRPHLSVPAGVPTCGTRSPLVVKSFFFPPWSYGSTFRHGVFFLILVWFLEREQAIAYFIPNKMASFVSTYCNFCFSSLIIPFDLLRAVWSWVWIPVGARFFAHVQTGPGAPPNLLYNGYQVYLWGKAAGALRWPTTPS
jgi:hypothetical protein